MIASLFRLETATPTRFAFLFVLHLTARTTAFALLVVSATLVWALPALVTRADELYGAPPKHLPEYLDKLAQFYPATISRHDDEFLYLKDGTKFPISDHRTDKTFQELLEKPDIADMFYAPYPMGNVPKQPDKNMDPGRVRFEPVFFLKTPAFRVFFLKAPAFRIFTATLLMPHEVKVRREGRELWQAISRRSLKRTCEGRRRIGTCRFRCSTFRRGAVKELIRSAKKRGYVTVDQINSVLPSKEANPVCKSRKSCAKAEFAALARRRRGRGSRCANALAPSRNSRA
jgi:Sigma-70 factor, region 1.1